MIQPRLRAIVLACTVSLVAGTAAAIDTYLYIPGVPGESMDAGHPYWIDLDSVSVGVANRECTDFTVTKYLDKSSPLLSGAAMSGGTYASMRIEAVKAGEQRQAFLTYTLANVVVGAVAVAAAKGVPIPMETVTLAPTTITMSYRSQRPDGSLDAPVTFTLSCAKK